MKWSTEHRRNAARFTRALDREGFNFFTGVPCSLLGALIEDLTRRKHSDYHAAAREDAALGMAAGAYLAGRLPSVLMQNSGLGYSLNVLTSLNLIYKIPVLLIVTYRGLGPDAPEHLVMGRACVNLLRDVGIDSRVPEADALEAALVEARPVLGQHKEPFALFIRRGIFGT